MGHHIQSICEEGKFSLLCGGPWDAEAGGAELCGDPQEANVTKPIWFHKSVDKIIFRARQPMCAIFGQVL